MSEHRTTVLREQDLKIDVFRNAAANQVRITHLPTGKVVECAEHRSELQNKHVCLQRLREALEVGTDGGIFKSYDEMTPDQQVAWKLGYEQAKREAEEALRHDHFCECFECLVTRTLGEE